jgi:hypothetical protein
MRGVTPFGAADPVRAKGAGALVKLSAAAFRFMAFDVLAR